MPRVATSRRRARGDCRHRDIARSTGDWCRSTAHEAVMVSRPSSEGGETTAVLPAPLAGIRSFPRWPRWLTVVGLAVLVMAVYASTFARIFELYLHADFHH